MVSDAELEEKLREAKKSPTYPELALIAVRSSSCTNAANTARMREFSLEEQQHARWIRMYIERRLFNEPGFLQKFLEILNLQQETSEGGAKVTTSNESMKVGYLEKFGLIPFTFGLLFFAVSIVFGIPFLLAEVLSEVEMPNSDFNVFLGFFSFLAFAFVTIPVFIWIGAYRNVQGRYSTLLLANVFCVECAYREGSDVFMVISGSGTVCRPSFVLLEASPKLEIIGFPEKVVGPGEFYVEIENRHTEASGIKCGQWYKKTRKWRTCTFIPVDTNTLAPTEDTAQVNINPRDA